MTCKHETTVSTKRNTFCVECGEKLIAIPERRYLRPKDIIPNGWQDMGDMPPFDQPFWVAWQGHGGRWLLMRLMPGDAVPPMATRWHKDLMGLPVA